MNYWVVWKSISGKWRRHNDCPVTNYDGSVKKLLAGLKVSAGDRLQECRVISLPNGITLSANPPVNDSLFALVKEAEGIITVVDMENLGATEELYLPGARRG